MASLEATLLTLAQQTAQTLLRAFAVSSVGQLASLQPAPVRQASAPRALKPQGKRGPAPAQAKGRRGRPPKAAGAAKGTKAAKSTKAAKPRARPLQRRTAAQLDALAARVIEHVRQHASDHPEGQSAGEIARALRVEPEELGHPMRQALAQGALRKTGLKNATRYFPGEAGG